MTLGNIIGGIHNPIDFLNPNRGPFALLLMATLIWVWAAMLYWLLARGGAEELAGSGHMSLVGRQASDPRTIKLIFILRVAGGFCALVWYVVQRS
jgi:hypothetical protein